MPRPSRIDAPGALRRLIIRGIERRKIFKDDADPENLVDRLATAVAKALKILEPAVRMSVRRGEKLA